MERDQVYNSSDLEQATQCARALCISLASSGKLSSIFRRPTSLQQLRGGHTVHEAVTFH
jgi:hypothetical protein